MSPAGKKIISFLFFSWAVTHGLIDDNLRPEENPLQAILHSECWRLGDLVDNEIYRPRGQVPRDRRKEKFHLGFSELEVIEHSRWGRQQNPSLVCFYVSYQNSMVSRDVKEQRPSSRVKLK